MKEKFPKLTGDCGEGVITSTEALQRLIDGNARFVKGRSTHQLFSPDWRKHLAQAQHPFATILGCSDSRVPPEMVFDQGLGDLFIIRLAGNVVTTEVLGSLGYALAHLHTPLFVVLGHEDCGAVKAALDVKLRGNTESPKIAELLNAIMPALDELEQKKAFRVQMGQAVEANVRWAVHQLAETPAGSGALAEGRIQLVGAVYRLTTGRVRFLKPYT